MALSRVDDLGLSGAVVMVMVIMGAYIWSGLICRSAANGRREEAAPPEPGLRVAERFSHTPFLDGFVAESWAAPGHAHPFDNQASVNLSLDRLSGASFHSKEAYLYGFFSASIKLPDNYYTAGVVITFYVSNSDLYPSEHDELDFEFLGRELGQKYVLQTNLYMHGNTSMGREQRMHLWFDPSEDYHTYSMLWTPQHIVYFVDDVPIRELPNIHTLHKVYPSRPTHVYGSIWDGSSWATNGGKSKINYSYSPFVASYKNFILSGCIKDDPKSCSSKDNISLVTGNLPPYLTNNQVTSMHWVRRHYMFYDYCTDSQRYPNPLPECHSQHHLSQETDSDL